MLLWITATVAAAFAPVALFPLSVTLTVAPATLVAFAAAPLHHLFNFSFGGHQIDDGPRDRLVIVITAHHDRYPLALDKRVFVYLLAPVDEDCKLVERQGD